MRGRSMAGARHVKGPDRGRMGHGGGAAAAAPAGFVDIAELRVGPSGGNVDLGVPVRSGLISGTIRSVRLNGSIVAQADRGTTDRDGYARWFHLSASQLSANTTYTVSASTDAEAASPVTFSDVAATTITANGGTFTSTAAIAAGLVSWWRRGPVVSEGVYDREIGGNNVRVRFLVAIWAHGESRCQTFTDNAYSAVGQWDGDAGAPPQLVYTFGASRSGSTTESFPLTIHPVLATIERQFGDQPAFATLQAIGFGGTAMQGHHEYVRDSRMWQNYQTRFDAPTSAIASIQSSQPGSAVEGDKWTPDAPLAKSYVYTSGVWVPSVLGYNGGSVGPFLSRNTAGGDDTRIGQHPMQYQQAVSNYSSDARLMMLWCVKKFAEGAGCNYRLPGTKKLARTDDGVDYTSSPGPGSLAGSKFALAFSDGVMAANSPTLTSAAGGFTSAMVGMPIYFGDESYLIIDTCNSPTSVTLNAAKSTSNLTGLQGYVNGRYQIIYWEQSHWGAESYLPYLMTGEYACLDMQLRQELAAYINAPYGDGNPANAAHGMWKSGQYRHSFACNWDQYYDTGTGDIPQERQQGWAVRTTVHTCAIMPDDETLTNALWGWDKTMVRARWANVQAALYTCYVTGSTGPGKRFPSSPVGPRFTQSEAAPVGPGTHPQNSWMHGTIGISLCFGKWLGEMTSNGYDFTKWLLDGRAALYADGTYPAIREYMYGDSNIPTTTDGLVNNWATPGNPCQTWLQVYTAEKALNPGAAGWPVETSPNWNLVAMPNTDYFGMDMDMMADAQSFGCTQGAAAYSWMLTAASHFNAGNTWVFKVSHDIAPRTA